MDGMDDSTLYVLSNAIEISSSYLARALFRVFIRMFTTVVINCMLGNSSIPLWHLETDILKYATNVDINKSAIVAFRTPGY